MADSKRGPLRATDKRRQYGHRHAEVKAEGGGTGSGTALAVFNDRRKTLGKGKRAS